MLTQHMDNQNWTENLFDILLFSLLKVWKRNVLYLSTITPETMQFVLVIFELSMPVQTTPVILV